MSTICKAKENTHAVKDSLPSRNLTSVGSDEKNDFCSYPKLASLIQTFSLGVFLSRRIKCFSKEPSIHDVLF